MYVQLEPCLPVSDDAAVGGRTFGSDQERLLESEFQRFVRLNWEIVTALAGTK